MSYRFVDSFRAGAYAPARKFVKLVHLFGFITKKIALTLNVLTTTIVAPPSNASKWQWDLIRRLKG